MTPLFSQYAPTDTSASDPIETISTRSSTTAHSSRPGLIEGCRKSLTAGERHPSPKAKDGDYPGSSLSAKRTDIIEAAWRRSRRASKTRAGGAHVTAAVAGDFTFHNRADDRSRDCARTGCAHHRSTGLRCFSLSERRFELRQWRPTRSAKTAQAKTSQTPAKCRHQQL